MVFLHHQEKILARRGYENAAGATGEYVQHVFTPTPQDKGVIAFRKWLQYSAGGGVPWAPGREEEREEEKRVWGRWKRKPSGEGWEQSSS
jgi:hypothetical protein